MTVSAAYRTRTDVSRPGYTPANNYGILAALLMIIGPVSTSAQETVDSVNAVITEQVAVEQQARASQQTIDKLDGETDRLLAEYRRLHAETRSMTGYNDQLEAMTVSQQREMDSIERQALEIETTSREVVPLIQRMVETLGRFVELDSPFLLQERRNRLLSLKEILERADVTTSEKYRRVLEAYNVEMEYGRTIEAYRADLVTGTETLTVDFLRLGRIALMYQTLDGEQTGYWDAERRLWVSANDYQRSVRQGLRIAKQQTAPDLLVVPVASPVEN